jgi:hypothetical protein
MHDFIIQNDSRQPVFILSRYSKETWESSQSLVVEPVRSTSFRSYNTVYDNDNSPSFKGGHRSRELRRLVNDANAWLGMVGVMVGDVMSFRIRDVVR